MGARRHQDLDVWQIANELRYGVWRLTDRPSIANQAWLRSQLRRSAHSACANIAEGFARFHDREFARYLEIAKGSMLEVAEHLAVLDLESVPKSDLEPLKALASRGAGAATRLIVYLRGKNTK